MPKDVYIVESGLAKKVKQIYIGIDDVARKIKRGYVGVDGVARLFFQGNGPYYGQFVLFRGPIQFYDPETGALLRSVGIGTGYRFKGASIPPGRLFASPNSNDKTIYEYDPDTGTIIHNGEVEYAAYNAIGGNADGRLWVGKQRIDGTTPEIDPDTYATIGTAGVGNRGDQHYFPLGGRSGQLWFNYWYDDDDSSVYDSNSFMEYDSNTWARIRVSADTGSRASLMDENEYMVANCYARPYTSGGGVYFTGGEYANGIFILDRSTFTMIRKLLSGNFENYKPAIIR